jgi:hypothetical protein
MFVSLHARRAFGLAAAMSLVLLFGASAPADEKPAAGRTYIGVLDGAPKNSLIAIVVQGNEVLAYACGEEEAFNMRTARWFRGAAADGEVLATTDGVKLTATIGKDAVAGTLTGSDGKALKFKATPAGEHAGLFRAEGTVEGEDHVAGWIADGKETVVGSHHKKKHGGSGGTTGSGGSNFQHKQTFKFPSNHAFHQDFNFQKHFFFQQGTNNFHAKKVTHVPPTHGGKK